MSRHAAVALAAALSIAACADQTQPTAPDALTNAAGTGPARTIAAPSDIWRPVVTGETGPGAEYAFYVPKEWNGDVVYYVHGIRLPSDPVNLEVGNGFDAFREALGARHYAVAWSSFSENGFAVKDGAQRTHQLRGLFTSQFGKPGRSYLAGTSLGGLIAQGIAEQHGSQYDGTLAMCAPLGGSLSEINYLADVRNTFDFYYPNVVPGNVMFVPEGTNVAAAVGAAQQAVIADRFQKLGLMRRIDQTPMEGPFPIGWLTSLSYAIQYDILALDNLVDHTHGHPFYDNQLTTYTIGGQPLADLNAGVGRYSATPDALAYLDKYYQPSGALTMPTIDLHTNEDPFVPTKKHETEFRTAVDAAGALSLLLQRNVPGTAFGHCTFSTAEMTAAFDDLAKWVETGAKPTA
jgi:hypothetical protein